MFEALKYSPQARYYGDILEAQLMNELAYEAEEGSTKSLDFYFKQACAVYKYDIGNLIHLWGGLKGPDDFTKRDMPARLVSGYQYTTLTHHIDIPLYGAPNHHIEQGLRKIFRNREAAATLGQSLYRYRAVSKPARYLFLSLVQELRARPVSILDIGGASGLGAAFHETQNALDKVAKIREQCRLRATRGRMRIANSTVVDLQPPDDNWMLACSTLIGHTSSDDNEQVEQSLKIRNKHPDRFRHITGNIFDIIYGGGDPDVRDMLAQRSNVAVTSFVRYFDPQTYPIDVWSATLAECLTEDGLWFDCVGMKMIRKHSYPIH
jgi:hypothetical protein